MSHLDLLGGVSREDTGVRSANDFYETPAWMTRSLLVFHPAILGASVLECCSGRDAITRVLRDEGGCRVWTNDIDTAQPAETHHDARLDAYWQAAPLVEYVVTNPTFESAFDILTRAAAHASRGVVFLLRKSFLEPTAERGPWLAAHPPTRVIGQPRHSFRGKGSDSVASDWFIWEREWAIDRTLPAFVVDHVAKTRTRSLAA